MKKQHLLFATFILAGSLTVSGQTPDTADSLSAQRTLTIDEVVVTGTRHQTDIRHLSQTVSVVNRKRIEQSMQPSLLPVLTEQVPGLFTTSRGVMGYGVSNGAAGGISLRGLSGGNARLMAKLGLTVPDVPQTGTIVHVAIDGKYAGYLLISDVVKPHSAQAIKGLKQAGVRKTVMLTGDAEPVAKAVSAQLGLDEYHAGLLPGDKVDQIEKLIAEKKPKENLAFVGDGINDAPVLSRADVGIAMGALGSDAAIEAADVVLMDDDPAKIALAMRIARRTLRIVYQNIVFALAIKFACLVLGAIGMASMWTAIFADVGVMVIAVLNATRALYTKDLAKKNEE
mgnify:CR=1 FL=1